MDDKGMKEDAARQIAICFEIAKEFDADADMDVDEANNPNSRTHDLLAEATICEDYQSRVTSGHCCSLPGQADDYARRVIDKLPGLRLTSSPIRW